jgi:chromosome segregation ATPase
MPCTLILILLVLRYEMFMKAFDHISKGIDEIYKELTKSHITYPLGEQHILT